MIDFKGWQNIQCPCPTCQQFKKKCEEQEKKEMDRLLKNRTYEQGFCDGMSCNQKDPMSFAFMGYNVDQLVEIIRGYEKHSFYSGSQWSNEIAKELKERQKGMNEARQKREEFRAKLSELGRSEETVFSSTVLEAYDLVHCPELRKDQPVFEIKSDRLPYSIKIWADGRFEGIEGAAINRIPQLIAEAKEQTIKTLNQNSY